MCSNVYLTQVLKRYKSFGGVFACDELKTIELSTKKILSIIVNTELATSNISGSKLERLSKLKKKIQLIKNCDLKKNATNLVFGDGNINSRIMIVGEGPGANEDIESKPIVGRAGKLLDKMLASINLSRKKVYIVNVLKCRPPNNRDPKPCEIEKCEPYLKKQLEIINPKLIVALGRISAMTLLRTKDSLSNMRKNIYKS